MKTPHRPRILHIIYSLGRGGAETQLTYLSVGLQRIGWDVHIALLGEVPGSEINEARLQDAGVILHRLPHANNYDPRSILRLVRLISEVAPAAVQTWLTMMDVIGGAAALLTRKPWILSERNAEPSRANNFRMNLRRLLAARANVIVANSNSGITPWKQLGREHIRHEVIRNALPLNELRNVARVSRAELSISAGSHLIVYAGRLESQKNIENLLEAFAIVVKKGDATALIFGRGPQDQIIERFIADRGLAGQIILKGFVTDLWRWIKAADVFVSVSHFEGMPNAVMEAMALGRPVVVSDTPPHREICDMNRAVLVDRMNPEAIADAIIDCLDRPGETRKRTTQALKYAEVWSIDAAAQAYDQIYRRLIPKPETSH